jgi:hypothetical protein
MPETAREMVARANFSRARQCDFIPETFEMDWMIGR